MKRTFFIIATFMSLACFPINAQGQAASSLSVLPEDPAELLGYTVQQLLSAFGPPEKVYAVRGEEAWQDDVVFDYPAGFSFFLFKDHVWQVLVAKTYGYPVFGFLPGSMPERVVSMLGSPSSSNETMYEWILPAGAWPVRLRGRLDGNGAIGELYLYRADF